MCYFNRLKWYQVSALSICWRIRCTLIHNLPCDIRWWLIKEYILITLWPRYTGEFLNTSKQDIIFGAHLHNFSPVLVTFGHFYMRWGENSIASMLPPEKDPVWSKVKLASIVVLAIALLFCLIAMGAPDWGATNPGLIQVTRKDHIGLWRYCTRVKTSGGGYRDSCNDFIDIQTPGKANIV